MKFVDEASIRVEAGNGGHGCLSFRREKFVPFGGPDGGDGGNGGSIYLVANPNINTLVEFRHQRLHRAENGQGGSGRLRTGKSGKDLFIAVPIGTAVFNADTNELLGDLIHANDQLCVAKGGFHGLGNARFKSSVNRTPRKTTSGTLGEHYNLRLELKVLADVGLLGLPNAGKSTLVSVISNATPKIADYPFTTLYPLLGVVRVDELRSFVIADIPGLIEGASSGAGLGIQFLRHLTRTRLLLHLVDIAPIDQIDPLIAIREIETELSNYKQDLVEKPRWLIFTKTDLLSEEEAKRKREEIVRKLKWKGPVFQISAISKQGVQDLCYKLMDFLTKA